jgi:sugar/nucleoside kinase (ribokinase family)
MKSYDVYALGNALVDIEYHKDPAELVSMGIEKGVMTLIDEQLHNHLFNYLGGQHEKMACGGSAANTLIAIAQMGGQSYFSCCVANDMAGQFFIKDLKKSGLHTNADQHMVETDVTGKCMVFVTPDADRTMNTFLGASTNLSNRFVSEQAIADSDFIYLEGYLVTDQQTREAVLLAKEYAIKHNVKTALTLSDPNMMRFFREGMLEMIGEGVDLLFANEEEASELTETEDLDLLVERMKTYANTFAVTRGAQGALVYDGETLHHIQPNPVTAIDTLGAGDMFAGAFLYGLTHGYGYVESGQLASLASSKIVTQYGPRLSTQDSLEVLQQFNSGNS